MATNERLITQESAAQLLYVSSEKIDEWIRNGQLGTVKSADGSLLVRETDIVNLECESCFQMGCELASSPHTVDQAAIYFKKAIAANPRFNLAYFELGRMYYAWGRYSEADGVLKKSVELNACFPALMNHAFNSLNGGDIQKLRIDSEKHCDSIRSMLTELTSSVSVS